MDNRERGFTLIEILVAMGLFAAISVSFYQVLFSASAGSDRARDVVRVSEGARLGFNRMVRDTREAAEIATPTDTSYQIDIDFNGNGTIEPSPSAITGNYERLTFAFNAGAGTVTVTVGGTTENLMTGVECIPKAGGGCQPVFRYGSNRLEYDVNSDGVTDAAELIAAPVISNGNAVLDGQELNFVDTVRFALRVRNNDSIETFYAEAQMRNQR